MTCRTHTEPIEGFHCVSLECRIIDAEPNLAQAYANQLIHGPQPHAIDIAKQLRNTDGMTTEQILSCYLELETLGYMYWKDGQWVNAPRLTN